MKDLNSLLKLINNYYSSQSYVKLKKYYDDKNLWNIFNKTTDERLHTKFLCFLLDPRENQSIDTFSIEQLLRLLFMKCKEQNIHIVLKKYLFVLK